MNSLRLAFGTLTVLPVRPPVVDRVTAGWAMVLAPGVGLGLGLVVSALTVLGTSYLLEAALVVALLALLTRALHLDGLADTADGLGSGRPAEGALEVMRRSDIGPFGVATLLLVLLVQVTALAALLARADGVLGLVAAVVVSRLALPLACLRGVPSARPTGLGATVAGSVGPAQAAFATVLAAALVVLGWLVLGSGVDGLLHALVVAPLGLGAGALLVWRAVRRLGGITGDVLGAAVEVTLTTALVLLAVL